MDTTSTRFKRGVHKNGECGKNISGYAAISAAVSTSNVHQLSLGSSPYSVVSTHKEKKRSFLGTDILAFLFLRFIYINKVNDIYVLLLSSETFKSTTIDSMISTISKSTGTVIIVNQDDKSKFIVKSISSSADNPLLKSESICEFHDCVGLVRFFKDISSYVDLKAMVYPKVTDVYTKVISVNSNIQWCAMSSSKTVYVSKSNGSKYIHNAFPWSSSPRYSGYTIGCGGIREGNTFDMRRYMGSFNYYEKMISSVPLGSSCVDCHALSTAGKMLDLLHNKRPGSSSHRLSSSSIEALDELNKKLSEIIKSS